VIEKAKYNKGVKIPNFGKVGSLSEDGRCRR